MEAGLGMAVRSSWRSFLRWESEEGDRRWYVAVVSVKPVVSNPAARSMIVVSCSDRPEREDAGSEVLWM